MTILAYDRTGSVRSFDDNGRLRVERTPISKANICAYQGCEIPNYAALGLNPDQTYRLLRAPDELAKAADSFNSLPILEAHTPTSAQAHPRDLTVGATMDNARYEAPYLTVGMVIFDGPSIQRIQSGIQKELSCGYAYDADMTPGRYEGRSYDGRMTNIRGNHIALVTKGRAGPDVFVHDGLNIPPSSPQPSHRNTAFMTHPVTSQNKPSERLLSALAPLAEKMKKDGLTEAQITHYCTFCADQITNLSPELISPRKEAEDNNDIKTKKELHTALPHNKDTTSPAAKTHEEKAASLHNAIQKAIKADRALRRATEDARRLVRPLVGDVHGMDSAHDVYLYALQHTGMAADSLKDINQAGLRALVQARLTALAPLARPSAAAVLTSDSAISQGYKAPRHY